MKDICLVEPVVTATDVIAYRESLGLTQKEFAAKFQVPIGTIRNWEQGLAKPNISFAKLQVCNKVIAWTRKQHSHKEAA